MATPGPKRDDPLRQAALKENARRQMEAEFMEECRTLKREGAKAKDIMRCVRAGRRTQAGVIVGESPDGTAWVLRLANGRLTEYLKGYCERQTSHEAGKAIRRVRKELRLEPLPEIDNEVYGDGDV